MKNHNKIKVTKVNVIVLNNHVINSSRFYEQVIIFICVYTKNIRKINHGTCLWGIISARFKQFVRVTNLIQYNILVPNHDTEGILTVKCQTDVLKKWRIVK